MKKYLFLAIGLFFLLQVGFSQLQVQTRTENFDTTMSISFSSTPPNWWKVNTNYYVSPPNSYWAIVPNMPGDSVVLQTPVYNFTGMDFVSMRFKHICKISPMDKVSIEYKINSQNWQSVPNDTYQGEAANFASGFSAASYPQWQENDSLAVPNSSWWKEELFDISDIVSFEPSVEFRFVLKHGTTQGTQISYGWLMDDFEVTAATHMLSFPIVEFITPLVKDTIYTTALQTINAKVKTTTSARIETPLLIYTVSQNGTFIKTDTIVMTNVSGDSLWRAVIPRYVAGTEVTYFITGKDTTENLKTISSSYFIKNPNQGSNTNSVALQSIDNPNRVSITGGISNPIVVTIQNNGEFDLDSVVINWTVNGTNGGTYTWRGHLPWDFTEQDTIGYYTPGEDIYDTLTVWTTLPNGQLDLLTFDDTLFVVL